MNKTPLKTQEAAELIGKGIAVGEKAYVPTKITYYEDAIAFDFDIRATDAAGKSVFSKNSFRFDYAGDARLLPVTFEGIDFLWDKADEVFRWLPRFPRAEMLELNPWMETWDNGELLVDKTFADAHLSEHALAYAFETTDTHYTFNLSDYSFAPIVYEVPRAFKDFLNSGTLLDPAFESMFKYLSFYAPSYIETVHKNPDYDAILQSYMSRFYEKLNTPDGEY